jgi:hypothetical protein
VTQRRDRAWVGVDVGKTHHWMCAVGDDGTSLLSKKIANDEADILAIIAAVRSLADELVWAVDIIGAPSALLLALLAQAGLTVRYASGRVVAAMSAGYAGEGKTDAKDAYVIAETARLRRDLAAIDADTDLVRNLAVLTGHRADLVADRVRMINRLRDLMTSVFPGVVLLDHAIQCRHQTPTLPAKLPLGASRQKHRLSDSRFGVGGQLRPAMMATRKAVAP